MHLCRHLTEIHQLLDALTLLLLISCKYHIESSAAWFGTATGGLHHTTQVIHKRGNSLDGRVPSKGKIRMNL
jgi:hypothetical protein